jgi:hypothetical protein
MAKLYLFLFPSHLLLNEWIATAPWKSKNVEQQKRAANLAALLHYIDFKSDYRPSRAALPKTLYCSLPTKPNLVIPLRFTTANVRSTVS